METFNNRKMSREIKEPNLKLNMRKIIELADKDASEPPLNTTERRMKNISADVARKPEVAFNIGNELMDKNNTSLSRKPKYDDSDNEKLFEKIIKLPSLKSQVKHHNNLKEAYSLSFRGQSNRKGGTNEIKDKKLDPMDIRQIYIVPSKKDKAEGEHQHPSSNNNTLDFTPKLETSFLKKDKHSLTPNIAGTGSTLETFGKGNYFNNVEEVYHGSKLLKSKDTSFNEKLQEPESKDMLSFQKHLAATNLQKQLLKYRINKEVSLEGNMPIVSPAPVVVITKKERKKKVTKSEKETILVAEIPKSTPTETHRGRKKDPGQAEPHPKTVTPRESRLQLFSALLGTSLRKSPKPNQIDLNQDTTEERNFLMAKFEIKESSHRGKGFSRFLIHDESRNLEVAPEQISGGKANNFFKNLKFNGELRAVPYEIIKKPKNSKPQLINRRKKLQKESAKTEAELALDISKKTGAFQENIHGLLTKKGYDSMPQNSAQIANQAASTAFPSSSALYDGGFQAFSPYARLVCDIDIIFSKRFHQYFEFLAQINYSNRLIINLNSMKPLKYYVGKGNNSKLIKSLMKKRWWWMESNEPGKDTNFLWTQLKIREFIEGLSLYKSCNTGPETELESEKKAVEKVYADFMGRNCIITDSDMAQFTSLKMLKETPLDYNSDKMDNKAEDGKELLEIDNPSEYYICNHMEFNAELGNKKALYYNLKIFYEKMGVNPFEKIPLTFHITRGTSDPDFINFKTYFWRYQQQIKNEGDINSFRNVWIIKPGENTNRGTGIIVSNDLNEIQDIISSSQLYMASAKSFIIQKYIENPLLYCKRKFDIRCYFLLTNAGGSLKGYWYQDGYIRTSAKEYTTKNLQNRMIHLTNDAVQKKGEEYGKYESANKISYQELQRYLTVNYPDDKINFYEQIYPEMKSRCLDAILSVYDKIDSNRRANTFEIFGLDYMIDDAYKVWLIEINSNPCLELSSGLLGKIIPSMVENAFRISIDTIYPPPLNWPKSKKYLIAENAFDQNRFYLLFDERQYTKHKNDQKYSTL